MSHDFSRTAGDPMCRYCIMQMVFRKSNEWSPNEEDQKKLLHVSQVSYYIHFVQVTTVFKGFFD